ncbi:hypothetical protein COBT_000349 [Conglomerata obtusa]
MLLAITFIFNILEVVLARRRFECGPPRKECDWYICADSKYNHPKKENKCRDYSFCTETSTTRCFPRRKCRKDRCSSSSSSSSSSTSTTSTSSSTSSSSSRSPRRDAVLVIEEILALEALEAGLLVTNATTNLTTFVTNTLTNLASSLTPAIANITNTLVLQVTGILTTEEAAAEDDVLAVIAGANDAFTAAAYAAIAENKALADSQISHLGHKNNHHIVKFVKDKHHGLTRQINQDFNDVSATIAATYPVIQADEIAAIITALQGLTATQIADVVAAVNAANAQIGTLVANEINQANKAIVAEIGSELKELGLALDLLFCETGHLIIDIVKQVYDGKKVVVPRRIAFNNHNAGNLLFQRHCMANNA